MAHNVVMLVHPEKSGGRGRGVVNGGDKSKYNGPVFVCVIDSKRS